MRGGLQKVGGILWAHWSRELKPLVGINQIVGHTPGNYPQVEYVPNKYDAKGTNWCLDCGGKYYGEIIDGEFFAKKYY